MIYERIRNLREDKDMTQTEMAEILNCSQRIYSNYERGEVGIPIELLITLAQFHSTSVDYLLGLTDENEWAKKVVEEYISRLVDGLNNAQPSAETREMTVEMSVTDGVWLPTNMETFATNLSSSVAA